ncbi:PA0069 family radical SAM protein [Spirosoma fluminis]
MKNGKEEYKKGRGAQFNTTNRFQDQRLDATSANDIPDDDFPQPVLKTQYFEEQAKQIISTSTSPDIPFSASVNPYQGCEHGCIYCYARNTHEYWGYSAGLDFESKIVVKQNAPALLERQFLSRNWQPKPIHFSGNTDCYQPAERTYQLTRQMLALCLQYRNPVSIITKNAMILRDRDLLRQLAELNLVHVFISLTTLNEALRLQMEPRTVTAEQRLRVIQALGEAGVPVGVMTAPIIPGLNDQEIPAMIKAAAERGARRAGYTVVRLNGAVGPLFEDWVRQNFPDRADKVLRQVADCHGGSIGDSRFGTRMSGEGQVADYIRQLHRMACHNYLSGRSLPALDTSKFRRGNQLNLFG